jgi:putative SOS response-associated peptidase YedK
MCGRYRLSRRKQLIAEYFDTVEKIDWEPRYNIAPTQNVGIIRQDRTQPVRKLSLVRWGLIPYWAQDSSIGQKMINARSETVLDKPAFRESFQNRRCLVPADGFYEWKRSGKSKQPIHIGMQDDLLFAFAGIWDRWKDVSGNVVETCSILTTTPNSLLAEVHDRMPVILELKNYDLWLDPGFRDLDTLTGMLRPFDQSMMKCYPVSTLVNAPANEGPECATGVELAQDARLNLF